jgi:hypothetical protein
MSAVEKVFFPVSLLMMAILQLWEPLAVTIIAETCGERVSRSVS